MKSSASKILSVIGAGGHARSVIALLMANGFQVQHVYDDNFSQNRLPIEYILNVPLVGNIQSIPSNESIVLAIGDNSKRAAYYHNLQNQVIRTNLLHPSVLIERAVSLGQANLVFPKVFINACAVIGNNNIINSAAIVEHECEIGNHNHISVNATLCGRVRIGNGCFIGAASVIKDKVKIANNVIIGAGSVVIRDITETGVYVGNPVKKIK